MRVTKYASSKLVHSGIFEDCPLCGQSKRYDIVDCDYGVEGFRFIYFKRSIFTRKLYRITKERYECKACGARWENKTVKEEIMEDKTK